jgi:hypothetical protein
VLPALEDLTQFERSLREKYDELLELIGEDELEPTGT